MGGNSDKNDIRTRMLAGRAALPAAARAAGSAAVVARLQQLPELLPARAVMGYAAFGAELDVDGYLRWLLEREIGVFLPRVDGRELLPVRVDDLDADLAPGWRAVREPRSSRAARPERLEAVVVPGVAFDAEGRRLGYGGGHFDRFLTRLAPAAVTVGVAFDEQICAALPAEAHDVAVDLVVTPTSVLRPKGARSAVDGDTG